MLNFTLNLIKCTTIYHTIPLKPAKTFQILWIVFGVWKINRIKLWKELYFIPRPQYYFSQNQSWETLENSTMIGDAAHRMPPFAGKGANLAMLDAFELAESLTSNQFSDTKTAISYFEKRMLKRAEQALNDTLNNGEQLHSENALNKLVSIFNCTAQT